MSHQCGQVSPRWVRLKDIKWDGQAKPEPHFMIAYERCTSTETRNVRGGWFCTAHGGMQLYSKATVMVNGVERLCAYDDT